VVRIHDAELAPFKYPRSLGEGADVMPELGDYYDSTVALKLPTAHIIRVLQTTWGAFGRPDPLFRI
jgi:hypothetical protein